MTLDEDEPDLELDVYVFREAGAGSIGFRVYACPAGVTIETLDPAACTPIADGYGVALSGGALTAPLTLADAEAGDGDPPLQVFADLPFGEYVFAETTLPDGYTSYFVPGSAAVAGLDDGAYAVAIDDSAPDIVLDVYNLQETPPRPRRPPRLRTLRLTPTATG